jgi:hypothetical protein
MGGLGLAIQIVFYAVGIPLQILTISALLRGVWRQYPLVFLYVIASFLATLTEVPRAFRYFTASRYGTLAKLYWVNEGILQVLILAVVVGFIYSATNHLRSRQVIRFVLLAGTVLFTGITFWIHYDPSLRLGVWMTTWGRYVKLCATFLDLALWTMLISSARKDRLLLTLTGAMGIMFAGEAIGGSIRTLSVPNFSEAVSLLGSIIYVLADILFMYIWWQAFRRAPVTDAGPLKNASRPFPGGSV